MSGSAQIPRIVVRNLGVDAGLYNGPDGEQVLILSPDQSFDHACAAVERFLPDLPATVVRALVRDVLPNSPELEIPPDDTGSARQEEQPNGRHLYRTVAVALGFVSVLAAAGIVLGAVGNQLDANDRAAASTRPFESATFQRFAKQGRLQCEPLGRLRARCTDMDGVVVLSEAGIGPRYVSFAFTYDREQVTLGVFPSRYALQRWKTEPSTDEMYPNVWTHGRYALWGTDTAHLNAYRAELLGTPASFSPITEALRPAPPPMLGAPTAAPGQLPLTLGAMAMGTLGVNDEDAAKARSDGLEAAVPPVTAVAVRLVLGTPPPEFDEENTPSAASPHPTDTASPEATTTPSPLPAPSDRAPLPPQPDDPEPTSTPAPLPKPAPPSIPDPAPTIPGEQLPLPEPTVPQLPLPDRTGSTPLPAPTDLLPPLPLPPLPTVMVTVPGPDPSPIPSPAVSTHPADRAEKARPVQRRARPVVVPHPRTVVRRHPSHR